MGYSRTIEYSDAYIASETQISANNAVKTFTDAAIYHLAKEETIISAIYKNSVLRIKFSMRSGSGAAFGKIYYNGIAAGTERTTAAGAWTEYVEDIGFSNLQVGDKIQIYGYNIAGQVSLFGIFGTSSKFFNSVV